MRTARFDLVIPTLRRPSLSQLLLALDTGRGPAPGRVIIVDDRPRPAFARELPEFRGKLRGRVEVVRSGGRGPAAARNLGWRACSAPWIAFVDDDVLTPESWLARLHDDIANLDKNVAGSQGRIHVPHPAGRAATDWERSVIGLESARWITADMTYRRSALELLGGFDERFMRAYREDSELAIRALRAGYRLVRGRRDALHPIRQGRALVSVRAQAGNADDVLLTALHGIAWRRAVSATGGRFPRHVVITLAAFAGALGALGSSPAVALLGALVWLTGTAELAAARIIAGPRTPSEIALMIGTSMLIPPVAVYQRLRGYARVGWLLLRGQLARRPRPLRRRARQLRLVLFDRDGTLIVDQPGRGADASVRLMPTARRALRRLRRLGIRAAIVTNQPGLGRGAFQWLDLQRVHTRIERMLGSFAGVFVCPHPENAGCNCRKPAPGLLLQAMHALRVRPSECAYIGDIGSDMQAAASAGMRAVLVPNPATRMEEVTAAPVVARDLDSAVRLLLEERT
jgi:histidinol-phosphate phosphatase family protein